MFSALLLPYPLFPLLKLVSLLLGASEARKYVTLQVESNLLAAPIQLCHFTWSLRLAERVNSS